MLCLLSSSALSIKVGTKNEPHNLYLSYLESKSEIFQYRFLADFVQKRAVKGASVRHGLRHRHVVLK